MSMMCDYPDWIVRLIACSTSRQYGIIQVNSKRIRRLVSDLDKLTKLSCRVKLRLIVPNVYISCCSRGFETIYAVQLS
jgi:hypothetical protein